MGMRELMEPILTSPFSFCFSLSLSPSLSWFCGCRYRWNIGWCSPSSCVLDNPGSCTKTFVTSFNNKPLSITNPFFSPSCCFWDCWCVCVFVCVCVCVCVCVSCSLPVCRSSGRALAEDAENGRPGITARVLRRRLVGRGGRTFQKVAKHGSRLERGVPLRASPAAHTTADALLDGTVVSWLF